VLRLEASGRKYLKPYWGKRLLLAPNHVAGADGAIIHIVAPQRLRFVISAKAMGNWLCGPFLVGAGHIAADVNRENVWLNVQAILDAHQVLAYDQWLAIFGEGNYRRSDPGRMLPYSESVAWLALETQTPVAPIGIVGSTSFMGWLLWGSLARVHIGRPIDPAGRANTHENREELTQQILAALSALSGRSSSGMRPRGKSPKPA
jgi:1-acyl-sn-glycerol-3-phosphate acyltransferase